MARPGPCGVQPEIPAGRTEVYCSLSSPRPGGPLDPIIAAGGVFCAGDFNK